MNDYMQLISLDPYHLPPHTAHLHHAKHEQPAPLPEPADPLSNQLPSKANPCQQDGLQQAQVMHFMLQLMILRIFLYCEMWKVMQRRSLVSVETPTMFALLTCKLDAKGGLIQDFIA